MAILTWLKKFWRSTAAPVGWAVLAALAFIAGLVLRGRSTQPAPPSYSAEAETETLQHEVEAARQVAEVEKVAEVERAKIEEAAKIPDDRDRLQRLADMVNREEAKR